MAVYRVQAGFPYDSAFPRDVITVTPHYSGTDPTALLNAIRDNLVALTTVGATGVFTLKAYNATDPPPQYPLATVTHGTGFKTSTVPRELALCFSYYAVRNAPRYRGRMYVPVPIIGGTLNVRPSSTAMTDAANFGHAFTTGLPGGHQFVVYSRKEGVARAATNYWVDDEWDIIRSRGLRGVTRNTGTLP
jgi:hypothetical protein